MGGSRLMLCNRCGGESDPIYVHGHIQCSICHQVVDDCCQGERSQRKEVTDEEENDTL